jgi:hypothetical protein
VPNIIGETVVNGVPHINGVAATKCEPGCGICKIMAPAFAPWKCPHCKAHLGRELICLNLCGMSVASARRFNEGFARAREKKP